MNTRNLATKVTGIVGNHFAGRSDDADVRALATMSAAGLQRSTEGQVALMVLRQRPDSDLARQTHIDALCRAMAEDPELAVRLAEAEALTSRSGRGLTDARLANGSRRGSVSLAGNAGGPVADSVLGHHNNRFGLTLTAVTLALALLLFVLADLGNWW